MCIAILFFLLLSLPAQVNIEELSGSYFGLKAPRDSSVVFIDGIISTLDKPEMCAGFSPDAREFYYNALLNDNWTIFVTKEIDGKWTKPEPINFTAGFTDRDFTMSPDGKQIYFGSNRPRIKGKNKSESLDIFVSNRLINGEWDEPSNLGSVVNSDLTENYPSVAENGNLYFFSCGRDGFSGCDIFISKIVDNNYLPPVNLGPSINSNKNDWDAFIAPDESYIIFSSQNRDDTIGGQDLYISFEDENNEWTQAINMGPKVNSASGEICPSVTPDGKYLFFTSRRRGMADIFWIDASIIDSLKGES